MNEDKIKAIKEIVELIGTKTVTSSEFLTAFKKLADYVNAGDKFSADEIKNLKELYININKGYLASNTVLKNEFNKKILDVFSAIEAIELKEGTPGKDADSDDVAESLKNDSDFIESIRGEDADEEKIIEAIVPRLENDLPRFGEKFRDGLELLEGDERLDVSAIKGLDEKLETIRQSNRSFAGGGTIGNTKGHIVNYDLSSQLDGIKTTFQLPANWTIINVVCSSYPSALRSQIDYTFTPTSITFTSQIDVNSTLAAGQTLIVIYEDS